MRRAPRVRAGAAGVAALLAGCVLASCTGGTHDNGSLADTADGKRRPGPGQRAPGGAPGYQEGRGESGSAEAEPSRPADFRSTFALDVDTASYGYARRTLREGALPDPGTVRTEEFVNSFPQGYARPAGDGFGVTADGARTGSGWSLLRVGLATKGVPKDAPRKPAALTFVLDVSGSMAEPGRLDLVKHALREAAGALRPSDSVALVTFSGEAETVLPMTRLGDGGRDRLREAVAGLKPQNSTNLGAGMSAGYAQAAEHRRRGATNRVVLLSDALANTGDTDARQILGKVAEHRKKYGISLFGVGVGSEYGDALMERLTNKGDGHTAYISGRRGARRVFVDQLPRNIGLRARDAKAQVVFDRETVDRFRLLGYENRKVANDDFRDDKVDGGEIGPGHTVTALYAVRLKGEAEPGARAARATVRWLDPDNRTPHERTATVRASTLTGTSLWGSSAGEEGAASPHLRLTAAAAYFADALRARPGPGSEPEPDAREEAARLPAPPSLAVLRTEAARAAERVGGTTAAGLAQDIARAERLMNSPDRGPDPARPTGVPTAQPR